MQGRQQGVMIPEGQRGSMVKGEPNTLTDIAPIKFYAVKYYDEYGREHKGVIDECGGICYVDPSGETWAQNVRQLAPWLKEQFITALKKLESATSPEVTKSDKVDVIGPVIQPEKV